MSTTVTYKGNTLTTVNNETKSLLTAGTWLEDDIEITDTSSGGGSAALIVDTEDSHGGIIREITTDTVVHLQGRKTVTPTTQTQIITADEGYDGIVEVEVEPGGGVPNIYQDENGVLILDSEPTGADEWKRPLDWMPYADGWDDDDFDGCYFVYDLIDNTNDLEFPLWWGLYTRIYDGNAYGGQFIVDEGYVDNSGNFEIVATQSQNSGITVGNFLPMWDGITPEERYYVIRVTPSTGKKIEFIGFDNLPNSIWRERYSDATVVGSNVPQTQHCIEIYGRLPNYTSSNYVAKFRCMYLEHVYLLDLESLTNINYLFTDSYNLRKIDGLSTWDTSGVTNMTYAFSGLRQILDLNGIENWNVESVTNFSYLFAYTKMSKAKEINLRNWQTQNSPNVGFMFRETNAEKIVLPKGLTGNESQSDLFRDCRQLRTIDFNGSKVMLKSYTFINCNQLVLDTTSPYIITSTTSVKSTNMNEEFNSNYLLTKIDLRGEDTSSVTTMTNFANNCWSLQSVNLTGCDFSNVTNTNGNIFASCPSLVELKGFVYYQSFLLNSSLLMPAENLVEVLTNLPTVDSAKTVTISTTNKNKLTAEQIAIATEKGWTVA